jgi:hypothetical protein
LEDLKEGKLDRIEERQAKDPDAKVNSVIIIIKEKEVIREVSNPWYWPYTITIQNPIWYVPSYPTVSPLYCTNTVGGNSTMLTCDATSGTYSNGISINCSLAKDYSAGAYDIDGKIVNFR